MASEWVFDIPVKCVSRSDLFAEKLLANADRGMDSATLHRDILDFLVMKNRWGGVPLESLEKATQAYGNSVEQSLFCVAKKLYEEKELAEHCMKELAFSDEGKQAVLDELPKLLNQEQRLSNNSDSDAPCLF